MNYRLTSEGVRIVELLADNDPEALVRLGDLSANAREVLSYLYWGYDLNSDQQDAVNLLLFAGLAK